MKWVKVAAVSIIGGGIAGSVAAIADPSKYRFPQDLWTGRLWPFFIQGAVVTLAASLMKSPR